MKDKGLVTKLLYFLAAILFFAAAYIGKDYVFIPIGLCFIALGFANTGEAHK